jgi:hypothetical protein
MLPTTNQPSFIQSHRGVKIFDSKDMVPNVTKHKDGTETINEDRLEVVGFNFTGGAIHDNVESVIESIDHVWVTNETDENDPESVKNFVEVMNTI